MLFDGGPEPRDGVLRPALASRLAERLAAKRGAHPSRRSSRQMRTVTT
jgi:hypothetical protein